jgi:alpha-1,3-glucosyltransferase
VAQNVQLKEKSQLDFLTSALATLRVSTNYFIAASVVVLFSFMLRVLVGFGSYSGYNDPPRYGDFEAQRHWMELAVNSPPDEWYRQTYLNDLTWWRLDYPPMSGYFAWLVGQLSKLYDPKSISPQASRGYETPQHKNFMRWSVIIPDLLILSPILIILVKSRLRKFNFELQ